MILELMLDQHMLLGSYSELLYCDSQKKEARGLWWSALWQAARDLEGFCSISGHSTAQLTGVGKSI